MTTWINATVKKIKKWTPNLFSLYLNAPISSFIAGQFTKLSILNSKGKRIQRAYSFVNPPNNKNLEFYIVSIPKGEITKKLYNLNLKDQIMISKNSFGFFTLNEIPNCTTLWMFASGTAIGPYCSILQEYHATKRFKNIVLVHAVRYSIELNYLSLMKKLESLYEGKLRIVTIVSREDTLHSLKGRIPKLLENKSIEDAINLYINLHDSHVMLCGNPFMVKDTTDFLIKTYNMKKHFRRKSGHITTENYW